MPRRLRDSRIEDVVAQLPEELFATGGREVGILAWTGNQPVSFRSEGGLAITDDHLILGRIADGMSYWSTEGNSVTVFGARVEEDIIVPDPVNLWPDRIPYTCDDDLKDKVDKAVAHWNTRVGDLIRLEERVDELDFLSFVEGTSNESWVGKRGGEQFVRLNSNVSKRKVLHEIGHAAGLLHEHNRYDRDRYIGILWGNVPPLPEKHFYRYPERLDGLPPYDFHSIMHYRPRDGYGGQRVFRVKDEGKTYYENKYGKPLAFNTTTLSEGDVNAILKFYGAGPNGLPA